VVDPETLADVPEGQQGLLLARGPGVMAGYWQDDAATAKVGLCQRDISTVCCAVCVSA
jgi:acyl-CoA synthetase (AMP-forming)/AMP-acid ligase II